MNGSCAGGTGAFIDQMAVLLKTDANGVNDLAKIIKRSILSLPVAGIRKNRCATFDQ